jgi:glyoxylase-like metal-dependent hydrolase (beta-lactamase superfamily II)
MPEGSHRFQVGSATCTVLSDGYYSYPAPWFFPNADPGELHCELQGHSLPQDSVLCPCACLLVEIGRHTVLIDTGAGQASRTTGAIIPRLEMAGIRPPNVDTVILTHAHADHIGGAIDLCGRPSFPNARVVISEIEWEFWTSAKPDLHPLRVPDSARTAIGAMARRSLGALRHQIDPVSGECEVVPGIAVLPAPGHTPGHIAVLISSDGNHLLDLGDAAVHPLHLLHPGWENGFDLNPAQALDSRRRLLQRAAAESMRVMAFHFPIPSVGAVTGQNGGWIWSPG